MGKRRLRPPSQWLVVAVLVVLFVVAGGLALVQKWPGAAWWIIGGSAGLAAVVGGVGPLWQRWHEQRAAGVAVVRRSVSTAGTAVSDMSLTDLRVHNAVVDVPYLPRAAKEREVGDHLRARRPVMIVGPSMVGKTRLAAVAVEQVLPDKPLLLPDTATALSDLDKADITLQGNVIWLDDLERFLAGGGLTPGLVHRLCESNWLVATLRAHEWDRFQPTDQLRSPEWDVLRLFELVSLDRDRDRPADEDLRRAVPDEDIRERIVRIGIGEYVGAAQHIREHLQVGDNVNPLGYALVVGAADWSIVGITRPVPARLLRRLAASHLTGRRRAELDNEEKYCAALDWATREINPTVSLMEPDNETYRVYDFALDLLAATDSPVPAATWQLAVDEAADHELTSVGYQAMLRHNLPDVAERAWQKAAEAGHTSAMFNLGVLLQKRSELTEAERWWRRAANAGNDSAMNALGILLEERGEATEAEHWYRRSASAGNTEAMSNLGVLMRDQGKLSEAEHCYRAGAKAGNASAMNNLGALLQEQGKPGEAEHWCRQAAEADNIDAMYNLGVLLQKRDDLTEAEHWWRRAANADNSDAMFTLGVLLLTRADTTEAEHWWHQAANAGNTNAMNNLGSLLQDRGESTQAEHWWRRGATADNTYAMKNLSTLLQSRNEWSEAEEWLRKYDESKTEIDE